MEGLLLSPSSSATQRTQDSPRVWPRIQVQLSAHPCFQGLSGALATKPWLEKKTALGGLSHKFVEFPWIFGHHVLIAKILYQNQNYRSAQVVFLITLEQNCSLFLWKFPRYLLFGLFLEWNHTLKPRGFLREREGPFSVGSTENDSLTALEPTPSCHRCRHKSKIGGDKFIISWCFNS